MSAALQIGIGVALLWAIAAVWLRAVHDAWLLPPKGVSYTIMCFGLAVWFGFLLADDVDARDYLNAALHGVGLISTTVLGADRVLKALGKRPLLRDSKSLSR